MMEADIKLAQRLQLEEQGEITIKERSRLFVELMNKRKKHFAMLRAEEKRRKPPTKAQKRNLMSTYLKNMGGYKHNQLKSKSYEEIQKLFDNEMRRVNTFFPMDSEVVKRKKGIEESSKGTKDELESDKLKKAKSSEEKAKGSRKKILGKKRAGKEQQQESLKRQRIEDDKETDKHEEVEIDDEAELKKHLVIVKDDDIAIDAIPLATKPPMIVEYKLLKEGIMNLVKTKHGDTRLEDEHERVLWGDLKVMFEPDIRSGVWRSLQGYKVTIWKLYDSCGVHFVRNRSRIGINKWYQSFALRNFDLEDMEFESTNSGTTAKLPILKLAHENGTSVTKMSIPVTAKEKTNKKNDVKFDDLDYFNDFEKEFSAIVYNDALTSKLDFLTEPTVSPQHINEFNLKDETSLSECDEEEQNILNFNDLFPFNVMYPNDLKSDKDNDDDKFDIEHFSGDLSVKPLPAVINIDVGAYAHGSNKLLETRPRERNIDEYWWRIYKSRDLEVLES
ncbi:hypothetical protein Tco_0583667 [Tanacetum coccineum]